MFGVTENTISAKDVREGPLGHSLSEYLEKNESFFTAFLKTFTGKGRGLSEGLHPSVNVNQPDLACQAQQNQY